MQGIFINGVRPRTKKQVKEAVANAPASVRIEATSMFGNEFDGPVSDMPIGKQVTFVGPDPYTKRNFYGTIRRLPGKVVVS